MKKSRISGFKIGFFTSLCLHAILAFGIYQFAKTESITTKTQNIAPLVMSIHTFVQKPKEEFVLPQEISKPKRQIEKPKKEIKKIVEKPKIAQIKEEIKVTKEEIKETETAQDNEIVEVLNDANSNDLIEVEQQQVASSSLTNEENIIAKIVEAINKHKGYPERARRMNIEGVVYIEFLINEKGEVVNPKIKKSSGYKILDTHTIKSIKMASIDFPELSKELTITTPIKYTLKHL